MYVLFEKLNLSLLERQRQREKGRGTTYRDLVREGLLRRDWRLSRRVPSIVIFLLMAEKTLSEVRDPTLLPLLF